MKVIGVNGSPRKNGNTDYIMKVVFDCLKSEGIETEIVQIGGKIVRGCKACDSCRQRKDGRCVIADDGLNELLARLKDADGILLGSPTYTSDVTPEMKAFMDRAGRVSSANGGFFIRKAGAAVTAVRRGGAAHSLDSMNHWLHIQQTYTVGSSYWNMVYCREIGEAAKDEEGIKTMKTLGQNMAYLLLAIGHRLLANQAKRLLFDRDFRDPKSAYRSDLQFQLCEAVEKPLSASCWVCVE